MDLEATLSLCLHLVWSSLYKVLDHLFSGRKVVNRPRIHQFGHSWCPSDGTDEVRIHMDLLPFDPSVEGIASPPMQVGVELTNQILDRWAVILHHLYLTLGIQHCPYPWSTPIEVHHLDPSLYHYPTLVIVLELGMRLKITKTLVVIDMVFIIRICGTTGLYDGTLEAWPAYRGCYGLFHLYLCLRLQVLGEL